MIAEELQLSGAVSGDELLQKQPAEQCREYWDREQVARPAPAASSDYVLQARKTGHVLVRTSGRGKASDFSRGDRLCQEI
jgi:hypothetical protein